MPTPGPDYLTVRELAALLRVKERKVYALAGSGEIPCTRALGKLLFERASVDAWLARHSTSTPGRPVSIELPTVLLGSDDPLLDWALRESGSGIAAFFDGSLDGLRRLRNREGIAAGLHLHEPGEDNWNRRHAADALPQAPTVLIEWAWRERGLVIARDNPKGIGDLTHLAGHRVVPRQPESGTQVLFESLLEAAGVAAAEIELLSPAARSEREVAVSVADGKADAGFGLAGVARQFRLGFVSLTRERYDLLVDRRAYFLEPFQRLLTFCRSEALAAKARELGGYDLTGLGRIHYVGPG